MFTLRWHVVPPTKPPSPRHARVTSAALRPEALTYRSSSVDLKPETLKPEPGASTTRHPLPYSIPDSALRYPEQLLSCFVRACSACILYARVFFGRTCRAGAPGAGNRGDLVLHPTTIPGLVGRIEKERGARGRRPRSPATSANY